MISFILETNQHAMIEAGQYPMCLDAKSSAWVVQIEGYPFERVGSRGRSALQKVADKMNRGATFGMHSGNLPRRSGAN